MLLDKSPHETTEMLKEMCTRDGAKLDCEKYISLYANHPLELKRFLWYVVNGPVDSGHSAGASSKLVWNTLIELCLRSDLVTAGPNANRKNILSNVEAAKSPNARSKRVSSSDDVYASTSPALNLISDGMINAEVKERVVQETMSLLKHPDAKYDIDHTLMCVQQARCHEALLYLYEKRKMFDMMMQHYMDMGDNRAVLNTCKKAGNRSKSLGENPDIFCQHDIS